MTKRSNAKFAGPLATPIRADLILFDRSAKPSERAIAIKKARIEKLIYLLDHYEISHGSRKS